MNRNRGNVKEQKRRYKERHPERAKEVMRLAQRKWRQKHRAKARWNFLQYSNRKRSATGNHTYREWIELKSLFNDSCAMCGSEERITQDHKIPLSLGGTNDIDNIQPLCWSCNSKKGVQVWFASCQIGGRVFRTNN